MQTITLCGHLTADAEIRMIGDTERICFTVAANGGGEGADGTTFYSCMMRRTNVLNYLRKGLKVVLIGEQRVKVTEKEGRTFFNLNVYVDRLQIMSQDGGSGN